MRTFCGVEDDGIVEEDYTSISNLFACGVSYAIGFGIAVFLFCHCALGIVFSLDPPIRNARGGRYILCGEFRWYDG